MRTFRIVLLVSLTGLVFSATSFADPPPLVPPGVSGANQYTETLPGPGGNEPTSGAGKQGPKSTAKALGRANAERLESLGADGRAAAQLAAAGAANRHGGAGQGKETLGSAGTGDSGVGQVLGNLTGTSDSGGMGALLPLLILAVAIAAAAFVVSRRRAGRAQS